VQKLILVLAMCSSVSVASARHYWSDSCAVSFDQADYEHHRRWAATCLIGSGCLVAVSVVALMAAEGWDDCKDEIDGIRTLQHQRDVYKWNRDRLVITACTTLAAGIALALNAWRHDRAADEILKTKVFISKQQVEMGFLIHF
jgi:hypothetical protein